MSTNHPLFSDQTPHTIYLQNQTDIQRLTYFLDRPCFSQRLTGKVDGERLVKDYEQRAVCVDLIGHPSGILRVSTDVWVIFDRYYINVYASSLKNLESGLHDMRAYVKADEKKGKFRILVLQGSDICSNSVPISSPGFSDEDLALHYGPDFPEWFAKLRQVLTVKPSGLTVLSGPPGTGKTTLLKIMMEAMWRTHAFYYIPTLMFEQMSSMQLAKFWLQESPSEKPEPAGNAIESTGEPSNGYKPLQKVVILEDSEQLLLKRDGSNGGHVSALLNLSDGLMSSAFSMQIICTVNCGLPEIDPAIKRPGRMTAYREFPRLTRAQAEVLAKAKGLPVPDKEFSLAELYQSSELCVLPQKGRVGF